MANAQDVGREPGEFLLLAKSIGDGAIRQNQFKLDVENGKIDCVELWLVPSKNSILVKGGVLDASKIESLQKGIDLAEIELSYKLAVIDGRVYVARALGGGWSEVKGKDPFLGYGKDFQLNAASFSNYNSIISYWNGALKQSHKGTQLYADAEKNLAALTPKNGIVDYSNGKIGLRMWFSQSASPFIARVQELQDGIVFSEVQNVYSKDIPQNIREVISKILQGDHDAELALMAPFKGKKSLGLLLSGSGARIGRVVWVAPMGPAAKGGMRIGDYIQKINGKEIREMSKEQIKKVLDEGEGVVFTIRRDGSDIELPSILRSVFFP